MSNHTFVTEELRKILIDDFWFYTRDDIKTDALLIPIEMMHSLLKPDVEKKLRLNVINTLLEFTDVVIAKSPKHAELVSTVFRILNEVFDDNKDCLILASKYVIRYLERAFETANFHQDAFDFARRVMQENFRFWQETSAVEDWIADKDFLKEDETVNLKMKSASLILTD